MHSCFRITFDALEYTFVSFTCFRAESQQQPEGRSYLINAEDKLNETERIKVTILRG